MRVALFVTCLVDLFRPTVGFAAIKLLEEAGCAVEVPRAQTCCGQPAYNSGNRANAKAIALQVFDAFAGYEHVVAPSGSCAGMIRVHYPELFSDDPVNLQRDRLCVGAVAGIVRGLAAAGLGARYLDRAPRRLEQLNSGEADGRPEEIHQTSYKERYTHRRRYFFDSSRSWRTGN